MEYVIIILEQAPLAPFIDPVVASLSIVGCSLFTTGIIGYSGYMLTSSHNKNKEKVD